MVSVEDVESMKVGTVKNVSVFPIIIKSKEFVEPVTLTPIIMEEIVSVIMDSLEMLINVKNVILPVVSAKGLRKINASLVQMSAMI